MSLKRKSLSALISSLAVFAAFESQAQEAPAAEEMIITSSRVPIPLRQIGTSVSVITEEEIDAHGNLSLVDVLRQLPSIASSNNGGAGKTTSMRIRGEEGFRTLTILDGMRLSDPSAPQISSRIEHIVSSGVGRVEILRGPQGLSYGADAGGVVNITTRLPEEGFSANLDIQAGDFGTRQFSGNLAGGNQRLDYFVSVADFSTDGYNARSSDSVLQDDDGYDNTSVHARLGVNISDKLRLNLAHHDVDGDAQYDGCFSGTTVHDCLSTYQLSATRAELSYESERFNHSISYAQSDSENTNYALGALSFGSEGKLKRFEYVGSATELPGFNLVFGGDWEQALNNNVGRDNVGAYVEYLSDFSESVFFTAGVRHDDNDDFGTNNSYRLSGAYLIDLSDGSNLKFRAAYGTGFRAPSPYEIAYNMGPFSFAPASSVSLKQEKSKGYEFGVEYQDSDDWRIEVVYFDQDVEDAIYFDLATFSGYLQDLGTSNSKGLELATDIALTPALRFTANYTYNDTERPNGLQRRRRPEHLANFGLAFFALNDDLNLNAYYRISKDSIDESGGLPVALDDFEVMDVSANYWLNDTAQVYGRIENLLDEDYQEIIGYNSAERAAYVGVKFNF